MKALVVDDDRVLADLVAFTLRREGFQVIQAFDIAGALRLFAAEQPDLALLDVNLPKGHVLPGSVPIGGAAPSDGFGLCQHIRSFGDTPVIMLTVRSEEDDIIQGLQLGADDYIAKPFSPRQLVARVQAVLRRTRAQSDTFPSPEREAHGLALDTLRRTVRVAGAEEKISLTALECRLLDYLLLHAGHVLPAETLIAHVWGPGGGDRDMLRQVVRRLRAKIEPDPASPRYIETVPGVGYGLRAA